ncbi:DUF7093 family protein [Halolamina salifodinae]|uniref:Uncharacterized protein n=1 Tax=Halolamina salifodinae TaxID=1202767 RepID=A0A8T4GSJ5_9EURY|nr:hypothetical protein [Halolamina salifodinae]MBP1985826.1 hypothetical protein [Halolamina salifodinae]
MGLRCLLGHDFGEPETERERNEEGNEVVVTVREVKTCERCGEKQVVSENKEITSIDQLRESAGAEPTGAMTPGAEPTETDTAESAGTDWSTDELSTGTDDAGVSAESEPEPAAPSSTPEQAESVSEETEDPIDRGVADIIQQAEKDDDMLEREAPESEPESDAAEDESEEEEDVPVHPGQRGTDEDDEETPDAESDDGVILDEEEAPRAEEARKQWEEEASPEEVPGQDLSVSEPSAPDGEDAEIIDADAEGTTAAPEPEPEPETTEQPASEPQRPTESSSAVEDEDAEIMDAGPEVTENSEPEPADQSTEPEREETDEGHMPWPDAPGEDEGHDASVPDGEPADVDFGGGLTPSGPESEEPESEPAEPEPAEPEPAESEPAEPEPAEPEPAESEPAEPEPAEPEPESEPEPMQTEITESTPDRSNGHRTEDGEAGDASATPTANVDLERSSRDADMEYLCPECGLTRDVGNSSMRAGDICPECRKGYITEQQKAE